MSETKGYSFTFSVIFPIWNLSFTFKRQNEFCSKYVFENFPLKFPLVLILVSIKNVKNSINVCCLLNFK